MLGVTDFAIKVDYTVYVEFNYGQKDLIDLKGIFENDHREIICELLDLEKFKAVKIGFHTLCLDNGVDFAPEFLYEQIKMQKKVA